MQYGNLGYLYLLILIPILIIGLVAAARNRKAALERFAEDGTLSRIVTTISSGKRFVKFAFLVLVAAFLILALIEPRWGYHWEEVTRRGIDIVVAVDTSRSMLANDVKPNRLAVARREIEDLLRVLNGDRIGLIAFAGSAFVSCPLTLDYGAFSLFLDDLNPSLIPLGGTAVDRAIEKGIETFDTKTKRHKAIILITDGEDHSGRAIDVAREAMENGIIIYTVGIGKKEGSYIKVSDEHGNEALLKDENGQVVKSRLDEVLLNRIAIETGGAYTPAYGAEWGLEKIYTQKIAALEETELRSGRVKRYENRYQIPLFVAVILLTLESLIWERKERKRRYN